MLNDVMLHTKLEEWKINALFFSYLAIYTDAKRY